MGTIPIRVLALLLMLGSEEYVSKQKRSSLQLVPALAALAHLSFCKKEQSSPPMPPPVGDTDIGNTNESDCICGEMAELTEDTTSAFVRDDPCTGVAADHRNVVGILSRRRGATTVSVLHCDRFDWCFVRTANGRYGFVHGSVLRRDRSTDSPVSLDE